MKSLTEASRDKIALQVILYKNIGASLVEASRLLEDELQERAAPRRYSSRMSANIESAS